MNEEQTNVRSRKEIKRKLLKKAIEEGRGPEMILMIQWRLSQSRDIPEEDKKALEENAMLNEGQPRSIRMLNTLSRHLGLSERYIKSPKGNIVKPHMTLQ